MGGQVWRVGFIFVAIVGCADSDPPLDTESSALDTRVTNTVVDSNVARFGRATSSNNLGAINSYDAAPNINDGQRGTPGNAYWSSDSSATVYNCNYGNWWVRVDFGARSGETCTPGNCVRSIHEVDLFSVQDSLSASDPTTSTTTSIRGNVDYHLSYCPEGVTCGDTLGAGWIDVPGGYITANNKAWRSVSFAPVRASAVRATLDCGQAQKAYVAELEAWETQTPPRCELQPMPAPLPGPEVSDDDSTAALLADADRFWWQWFAGADDVAEIEATFRVDKRDCVKDDPDPDNCCPKGMNGYCPNWWWYARRAESLVKMYDAVAPVDLERAKVYLERLRVIAKTFLKYRDDRRPSVVWGVYSPNGKPYDYFHQQVMPAWGAIDPELDGQWVAQSGLAGLFTYPMAAFARRVADHPEWFCAETTGNDPINYRQDAIDFTLAVIDTYKAFKQDLHYTATDPYAYYIHPLSYSSLNCNVAGTAEQRDNCATKQKPAAGYGIPWNLSFSLLKGMGELAGAADSELFRTSWGASQAWYATEEAPRVIAKNVQYWLDNLQPSPGGVPGKYWNRHPPDYASHMSFGTWPEDVPHGQFTLGSITSLWENRDRINSLLARSGVPERMNLSAWTFQRIATNFLQRVWRPTNLIGHEIDGADVPTIEKNDNGACNGFLPLAQFDYWVWIRCRDSIFNPNIAPVLLFDNHSALIRYRGYRYMDPTDDLVWGGPGWAVWATVNGGYLRGTSEAVSSDWTIAGAGDFNGDGSSDILWRNVDGRLQVFLMRNGEHTRTISLPSTATSWNVKATGDTNNDGITDIVFQSTSTRQIMVWLLGRSANVIESGIVGTTATGWTVAGMGDFNHDGKSDLFLTYVRPPYATQTSIWNLDGVKTPGGMTLSTSTIASGYSFKGIARLNNEFKDDIIWRNSNGSIMVWRTGSSTNGVISTTAFSPGWPGPEWDMQTVADINGDAITDFVFVRASDRRVEGWLLDANGGLVQSTLLGYTDPGWTIRASGPFD